MADKLGIMVCGHGSRNQNAAKEFAVIAEALRARYPGTPVEYGYLEFCNPVLSAGLDKLKAEGVTRLPPFPACCLQPAMPRTTFRACSTPGLRKIPVSSSIMVAISASMPRCCGLPATASRMPSLPPISSTGWCWRRTRC